MPSFYIHVTPSCSLSTDKQTICTYERIRLCWAPKNRNE
uniref:Uncharacterized protein n=1 Tax=Anguilla anguilla TaxID=7936 RepID=A0A0E9RPS3_ANGAN